MSKASNDRDEAVERTLRKLMFDLDLPERKKSSKLAKLLQALTDNTTSTRVVSQDSLRGLAENLVDTHITKGGNPNQLLPE